MNNGLVSFTKQVKERFLIFFGRYNDGINEVVPVHSIEAIGQEANIDIALVTNGSGALIANTPDGTIVGGNKRGQYAVDFQKFRTDPSQVASGNFSFIGNGQNNTASGEYAVVINGINNIASGDYALVSGESNSATAQHATSFGRNNVSSGEYAFSSGEGNVSSGFVSLAVGQNNVASGNTSFAIGLGNSTPNSAHCAAAIGLNNVASGENSIAITSYANTNNIRGQFAFGHESDALGRYQTSMTGLRQVTTGTTPAILTTNGLAPVVATSNTNQLVLRNNSSYKVIGRVVAMDTVTLDSKEWNFVCLIKRGADATSTSLVGTPNVTSDFGDTVTIDWNISVNADTVNGALSITATGSGTNPIRWNSQLTSYEVMA